EAESKSFLAGFGISVTREVVVTGPAEAVAAASNIGFPVALKVASDAIQHKTDVGGVVLGLKDAGAVERAAEALCARFPAAKLLVQEMVSDGLEMIVGARRSAATGTVLMIGFGGVFTEVLDDVAFCRAPASPASVQDALHRLRSQRLLSGFRGAAA